MHPLDAVGKMPKLLAADMVHPLRSQKVPVAAAAVATPAPDRFIAVAGQIAASVVLFLVDPSLSLVKLLLLSLLLLVDPSLSLVKLLLLLLLTLSLLNDRILRW